MLRSLLTLIFAVIFLAFFCPATEAVGAPGEGAPGPGETITLKALLEEAKANNPELIAVREKARSMEAGARAAGSLDDPTFGVEMEDLSNDSPFSISPGNAMQTRYSLRQTLPFPGKLSLREEIAFKGALAARAELASKEVEVANRVKEAFFMYAFLDESIRIVEGIGETLSFMASVAEARYSTGQVSQQDVIKAHFEVAALKNEAIMLEAEREVAAARLKSAAGRSQDSPLGAPPGLPREKVDFNTDNLIKEAVERNPAVRMAELESQAGELGVDLAGKNYYPDFMVGVAPIQREGKFDSYDLMFQVNIPIWRGKYDTRVREASALASSKKSELRARKVAVGFEVKAAALEVEAADRVRTLYETSLIPQAELSFESALKNYQLGKVDFLTLLDTERELKRVRLELIKAILDYRLRVAALEKAVGADF